MSNEEHFKRERLKCSMEEEHYSRFSFKPKINKHKVYQNRTPRPNKSSVEEFSFTPKTCKNPEYRHVSSSYSDAANILKQIKDDQRKMEEFTR